MAPVLHRDLIQGSDEWAEARRGLITASEMSLIVTPTLKVASNEKERVHLYELLSQRITGYVEPSFQGFDMLRGHEDEIDARARYDAEYAAVEEVGFITNDRWGFTLGYSPDGLVGDDGLIECKGRRAKYQVQTLIERAMPAEYALQVQTGLLVSERRWCDFVSYCGGLPMMTLRIFPDPVVQDAIVQAAGAFEARIAARLEAYDGVLASDDVRLLPTERRIETEIF